jgi:hypothetical protein
MGLISNWFGRKGFLGAEKQMAEYGSYQSNLVQQAGKIWAAIETIKSLQS